MKAIAKAYGTEIFRQMEMWAMWPPDAHVTVGAVGSVDGASFRVEGHLSQLGVDVEVERPALIANQSYASRGTSVVSTSTGVAVPVDQISSQIDANLSIRFERRNGIFLLLNSCSMVQTRNLLEMAERIGQLRSAGSWNDDWHVVTAVRSAQAGVIAVSRERGASVELKVVAKTGEAPLPEAGVSFALDSTRSLGLQLVAEGELTPFVSLRQPMTQRRQSILRSGDGSSEPVARGAGETALMESRPELETLTPDG